MVHIRSGFDFKPNLISKDLSRLSECIGKVWFKTKLDQFNSGVNLDFGVNFGFNPKITLKYNSKSWFLTKITCHFHSWINFSFNPEFGVKLCITKDKVTHYITLRSKYLASDI